MDNRLRRTNIAARIADIDYFERVGVHSEREVAWLTEIVEYFKDLKEKDEFTPTLLEALKKEDDESIRKDIRSASVDDLIERGETVIECYYSYLEEVASLGNNWW